MNAVKSFRWIFVAALVITIHVSPADLTAQIPIPTIPTREGADTVEVNPFRFPPPISPGGAFLRSMLLPGWGQAVLERRVTGAVFVLWEGITLAMMLKSRHQLGYMRSIDSEAVEAKEQEVEDWAILLGFNHLLAGAEAFIAAQLWDFPEELKVEAAALPGGGFGLGASITLP